MVLFLLPEVRRKFGVVHPRITNNRIFKDHPEVNMKGGVRVVHRVIDNIYKPKVRIAQKNEMNFCSQNAKAPETVPLAMAVGKMACASWVIGKESTKNKMGGITSRNLDK